VLEEHLLNRPDYAVLLEDIVKRYGVKAKNVWVADEVVFLAIRPILF
jgi:hypothetical protein